ncbi:MAG: response regulator [Planctomycetes bacterium]|nr:response regulator [Planctomycetota bacterium]
MRNRTNPLIHRTTGRASRATTPVILVVDDDHGVAQALAWWLDTIGARHVAVSTAGEAVEMLQDMAFIEERFDGMLVDFRLPDAEGCEVVRSFRQTFPQAPIAMITAFADEGLRNWLREWRVRLIPKPLSKDSLAQWLREIPPRVQGAGLEQP